MLNNFQKMFGKKKEKNIFWNRKRDENVTKLNLIFNIVKIKKVTMKRHNYVNSIKLSEIIRPHRSGPRPQCTYIYPEHAFGQNIFIYVEKQTALGSFVILNNIACKIPWNFLYLWMFINFSWSSIQKKLLSNKFYICYIHIVMWNINAWCFVFFSCIDKNSFLQIFSGLVFL